MSFLCNFLCRSFTLEEMGEAAGRVTTAKAPRLDDVLPEVVKVAATKCAPHILWVMNNLMSERIFPKEWKIVKIVLISK